MRSQKSMNDDLFLVEKNVYRNHVFCFNAEYDNWIGWLSLSQKLSEQMLEDWKLYRMQGWFGEI